MKKKDAASIHITDKAKLGKCRDQLARALAMYRYEKSPALSRQITALRAAIAAYKAV